MGYDYLLEMEHISKTFPGVKALNDVTLKVRKGEVHALIGENGAGKSTLIKILAGIYSPDPGAQFSFEGREVVIKRPIDATQMGISIIYQDLSLFPNLSIAENIYIGQDSGARGWKKVDWKKMKAIAAKVMSELDMKLDVNTPVEKLSIAQQQMIEIARALAFDSKLIVMDEPTSSLSEGEIEKLYKVIDGLKQKGISIIFVSHKLEELFRVSDQITVLRDGEYVGTYATEEIDQEQLITLMVGRKVEYTKKTTFVEEKGKPILEVKNFSKQGNFKDISLQLYKGEILGITGLVGSGRTELAQAIFGLNKPDSGTLLIDGKKVVIRSSYDAVKKRLAYIPEERQTQGLILSQPITKNISLPILKKFRNALGLLKSKEEKKLATESVKKLDIRPSLPDMAVEQLSGGNQQKVVISKWLATNPKILIVDEPTNGIDIGAKAEIHKLLQKLASDGMGIIVISSELPEVLALSDRILVMRHGRLAGELKSGEATQEKIMNLALVSKKDKPVNSEFDRQVN
jgi:ribose transport system ATP-binding protein/rhamnose transport system ATP-binding protein